MISTVNEDNENEMAVKCDKKDLQGHIFIGATQMSKERQDIYSYQLFIGYV